MTVGTTTDLDIDLIDFAPALQPRVTFNDETIDQYAEDMRGGVVFPHVVVYFDGVTYWLSQGFHRREAARQAGFTTIVAEVREGTYEDALWDAAGSNCEHDKSGMRRTNAD